MYKKQLLTFLSNFWATFWKITGNFLGNLEQLVESPNRVSTLIEKKKIQQFSLSLSESGRDIYSIVCNELDSSGSFVIQGRISLLTISGRARKLAQRVRASFHRALY